MTALEWLSLTLSLMAGLCDGACFTPPEPAQPEPVQVEQPQMTDEKE